MKLEISILKSVFLCFSRLKKAITSYNILTLNGKMQKTGFSDFFQKNKNRRDPLQGIREIFLHLYIPRVTKTE
jgi:hypothetical protein